MAAEPEAVAPPLTSVLAVIERASLPLFSPSELTDERFLWCVRRFFLDDSTAASSLPASELAEGERRCRCCSSAAARAENELAVRKVDMEFD